MPSQQATMESAPIEEVERMNVMVVRGAGQGQGQSAGVPPRQDPYAIEVDRGRNYYACREFRHMACHCRNRGRIEEIHELLNNLKEVENLELLN